MLRQPYNSEPPTREQLNKSSSEYSLLSEKYACVALPSSYVASVFGFTVETNLSTSDIGYAQSVFDAVDKLSVAVNEEMRAQAIKGIMIFSIKTVHTTPPFLIYCKIYRNRLVLLPILRLLSVVKMLKA